MLENHSIETLIVTGFPYIKIKNNIRMHFFLRKITVKELLIRSNFENVTRSFCRISQTF